MYLHQVRAMETLLWDVLRFFGVLISRKLLLGCRVQSLFEGMHTYNDNT